MTSIVWFKRDLRIEDNESLSTACKHGEVIPLYILEPELWNQPDMGMRHYEFLKECLHSLNESLSNRLIIKVGGAVETLDRISKEYKVTDIYSHQETWNGWTYDRDLKVKKWAKKNGVNWHESTQNGVIRRLKDRDGWAVFWYKKMKQPIIEKPIDIEALDIKSDKIPKPGDIGLNNDGCIYRQQGGRQKAMEELESFLYRRGEGYTKEMSSPVHAFDSCSRLSTHIAFGTISIREVFQATEKRLKEIKSLSKEQKGKWPSAIRSFSGRLRWHCHFIQKLEDEPRIEFKNMHHGMDGLREDSFNEEYFKAWKDGKTGYPMIDACMMALKATGWINFRMRAMLISFASYHLWLHWRKTSLHLATLFTDYEPGIHYSQAQMQSGTTGINSIRIYNPIKQGVDHDPDGVFIKKWIPELKDMPKDFIHTPWKYEEKLNGYPKPIVDEKSARKESLDRIYAVKKDFNFKNESRKIANKHGSRKSGLPQTNQRRKKNLINGAQKSLFS
jgi:deoxyribodipyrimidine photo-lyase